MLLLHQQLKMIMQYITGVNGDFINELELDGFLKVFPAPLKFPVRRLYQNFMKCLLISETAYIIWNANPGYHDVLQ